MNHCRALAALLALTFVHMETRGEELEPLSSQQVAFFEQKVRPILIARCYECHSAQSKSVRGGLLLDSKAGLLRGGDIGPAIEPDDPENSLLIEAVLWNDEALRMPPKGKLPDEEIEALTEWVRQGAPDPRQQSPDGASQKTHARVIDIQEGRKHWAFQPLSQAEPPAVSDQESWVRSPIDQFILAHLKKNSLKPSPAADKAILIRRLFLDVTGLPPSPEDIEGFVNDTNAGAYERLVDRLLSSPAHGERWARHWLDLARFAESHGFEHDYDRTSAYTYRDFLVQAINEDLPYDTFVRWQIAGDELAPQEPLALMATGFLAAGAHSTQITANQAEKERYDELDDMLSTTGTAFLGLTVGCARCHDHKYDPIGAEDYYRMLATFTTTVRSEIDLDLDPKGYETAKGAFDLEHAPYLAAIEAFEREELPARLAQWEASPEKPRSMDFPWRILDLVETKSSGGATLTKQPDGSVLASGTNPQHETYSFTIPTDAQEIRGFRLEALADPSLDHGGPGRASNGNFALTDFVVTAAPKSKPMEKVQVALANPRATFEQVSLPIAAAIDADGTSAWAVDPQFGKNHAAAFDTVEPIGYPEGTILTLTLRFTNNVYHSIGRVRVSLTTRGEQVPLDATSHPEAVLNVLNTPPDQRSAEQKSSLLMWYRTIDASWRQLKQAEQKHAQRAPKPSIIKALISSEGLPAVRLHTQGPDFYEKTFFLTRGDLNQKGEEAAPGFLRVLMNSPAGESTWRREPPPASRTSHRRAAFALWTTDVEHGAGALLARVLVNRLWQHHFGRGLVSTPSDFGTQGDKPSHPELLDWLPGELIRSGWSMKSMHRLILTSQVYRQTSTVDPAKAAIDIENRLLWRQNRRRLEAEVIRDAMLSVSGLLDSRPYGSGTLDETMTRRSLYFTVKRSRLIPMMTLFDAPDSLVPISVRSSTTVAPQALYLLNNPQVRVWAEAFAQRVASSSDIPMKESINRAFRLALGRLPDTGELESALAFVDEQAAKRTSDSKGQLAALADFCQVLFCTNSFMFVD